jgi:hypothetical protein
MMNRLRRFAPAALAVFVFGALYTAIDLLPHRVRADIFEWSITAGSNTTVEGISIAEGMSPAGVNNFLRAQVAALKMFQLDLGGENTSAGNDTITLTTDSGLASYTDGAIVAFTAGGTNTGAATLNVDSVGAQDLKKYTSAGLVALSAGDVTTGGTYLVKYETTNADWILLNASTVPDAELTAIGALAVTDSNIIVGNGTTWVAESGDTARVSLGVGTTDSPQFTGVNVGAASDTTVTRTGAGDIAVEGNAVYRAGGTDVPVTDGGTGASTAAGGATALGVGTGDSPQFTGVNLGHASDTTLTRSAAGVLAVEGVIVSGQEVICVAMSDETTAITTGTAKVTMRWPFAMTVTAVRASVNGDSSSGTPTVDINDSGTTILSTKLTIDANEETSTTAAAAAVISDTALADDAEVTFDVDTAGTGTTGLKACVYGTRA